MRSEALLEWAHVCGNLVWIGSVLAAAALLGWSAAEDRTRGELARWLVRRVALPAMLLSLLAGASRLGLDAKHLLAEPWMHAKLTMALAALVVHHLVGRSAKRLATGQAWSRTGARALTVAFAAAAALAALFVITRVPHGG